VWEWCRQNLPRVVTGARQPTTGDDNPVGALYNIVFVRIPAIGAAVVYCVNVLRGHPLVVNVGDGFFEMNPLAVFVVFYILLR